MSAVKGAGAVLLLATLSAAACAGDNKSSTPAGAGGEPPPTVASAAGAAVPAPAPSDSRGTVLFLGTSLTAGLGLEPDSAYPQQLQRRIDAAKLPYRTVNAGVSGETSAGLLRRLDWVLRQPASVIVVETGANDGLRGQPVAGTKATIGKILDRIRAEQPTAKVLLVQMEAPPNLGPQYTTDFHDMYPALAKEHGVTLLPFLLAGVAGYPRLNQGDGMHPNYEGEQIVTANVWRGLEGVLRASRVGK
jgi:acyl-CoA thioesterase-1